MTTFTKPVFRNITLSTTLLIAASFSLPSFAEGGSTYHSGQASKHSVLALAEGAHGSLKVASGIISAPIIVSAAASTSVGASLDSAGKSIANSMANSMANSTQHSSTHIHAEGPLEITNIIITADLAPDQVLNNKSNKHKTPTKVQEVKETHTTTISTKVGKTKKTQ